jgi:hypothetical protein
MIVLVVVVLTVTVLGDLKEMVFYSHEKQFRYRQCDIYAIPKYILVHEVYSVYGVRRKQKMKQL